MAVNIGALPFELHLQIISYLPASAHIALRLTSRALYLTTPFPQNQDLKKLELCERLALARCVNERQDLAEGKRWCAVCRTLQPRTFFHEAATPVCNWHEGWRMRVAPPRRMENSLARQLHNLASSLPDARWVAVQRSLCVGCLAIWGWDVPGRCRCHCQTCGVYPITCYVRLSPKQNPPRAWEWPRQVAGAGYVLEEHWAGGELEILSRKECALTCGTDDSRHRYWIKVPLLPVDESLSMQHKMKV